MIQRVQSLFLLVAAVAAIAVLFISIGNIIDVSGTCLYQYDAFSLKKEGHTVYSTLYIALLWGVSAILSLVTIFMFKNRQRQVRLNGVNMLVMLAALVMMLYIYPNLIFEKKQFITSTSMLEFNRFILISLIPAVSLYLANMFIKKDEKKVRAADRLR
jgi:cytochrome bd-type quinol oxidase subunit 2